MAAALSSGHGRAGPWRSRGRGAHHPPLPASALAGAPFLRRIRERWRLDSPPSSWLEHARAGGWGGAEMVRSSENAAAMLLSLVVAAARPCRARLAAVCSPSPRPSCRRDVRAACRPARSPARSAAAHRRPHQSFAAPPPELRRGAVAVVGAWPPPQRRIRPRSVVSTPGARTSSTGGAGAGRPHSGASAEAPRGPRAGDPTTPGAGAAAGT